jgi:hypothetical protein
MHKGWVDGQYRLTVSACRRQSNSHFANHLSFPTLDYDRPIPLVADTALLIIDAGFALVHAHDGRMDHLHPRS